MQVSIITAFPEFFGDFLTTSIIGRAVKTGTIDIEVVDLRSFGKGRYRQVDDYAFGAGGMVLMPQPLLEALESVRLGKENEKTFVVYPSPQGVPLTQEIVESLTLQSHVTIICGHYEGLDERFAESAVDLEVTIGDCVLTGGEIPAMAVVDAMARLVPGVVGRDQAVKEDSFYKGMLDHPHYTRPASWQGMEVPQVLLSGNASRIEEWRREKAVERTLLRRPDLLSRANIIDHLRGSFFVLVLVEGEDDGICPEYLDSIVSVCRHYGIERPIFAVPDAERRQKLKARFSESADGDLFQPKWVSSPDRAYAWLDEKGVAYRTLGIPYTDRQGAFSWLEAKRMLLESRRSVVLCFSSNEKEDPFTCDSWTTPVVGGRCEFSALPISGKVAVALDRFLGSK